jgi:hypothetical protein
MNRHYWEVYVKDRDVVKVNDFDQNNIIDLCNVVQNKDHIEYLVMIGQGKPHALGMHLGRVVRCNLHIKHISFNLLGLKDRDIFFLARALARNQKITYLDLSENLIEEKGARYLAKALMFNETLKILNISFNKIGFCGVLSILKALKYRNHVLEELYVYINNLSEDDVALLTMHSFSRIPKVIIYFFGTFVQPKSETWKWFIFFQVSLRGT